MGYIDAPAGMKDANPQAEKFVFGPENSTMTGTFVECKDLVDKKDNKPYKKYFFETNTGLVMIGEPANIRKVLQALKPGQKVTIHDTGETKEVGRPEDMRVFQIFIQE